MWGYMDMRMKFIFLLRNSCYYINVRSQLIHDYIMNIMTKIPFEFEYDPSSALKWSKCINFLHAKPWIPGGEKSIFMVVIH